MSSKKTATQASELVGQQLRSLRKARHLSIRALAERSRLSVNTLSLIENGKTSPSVNTLHLLAQSLDVTITAFFDNDHSRKKVVYQQAGERKQLVFSKGQMEKLAEGMLHRGTEPFITRLEPDATSGQTPTVFPGREFIYCLEGHITYIIEDQEYSLHPGDSLILESYTPYIWRNSAAQGSSALLVLCPEDSLEDSPERFLLP